VTLVMIECHMKLEYTHPAAGPWDFDVDTRRNGWRVSAPISVQPALDEKARSERASRVEIYNAGGDLRVASTARE